MLVQQPKVSSSKLDINLLVKRKKPSGETPKGLQRQIYC